MRRVHELKTLPPYFERLCSGVKTCEVRENDRDYQSGDVLWLREYDATRYTGASLVAIVTHVLTSDSPVAGVMLSSYAAVLSLRVVCSDTHGNLGDSWMRAQAFTAMEAVDKTEEVTRDA